MAMANKFQVKRQYFGVLPSGEEIDKISFISPDFSVSFLNLGALIQEIKVKKDGKTTNVIYGFSSVDSYLAGGCFGAIVGPVANRVSGASFAANASVCKLEANEGNNTRHSGSANTSYKPWKYTIDSSDNRVIFQYTHKDGMGGIPGDIDISAEYTVSEKKIVLVLKAVSAKETAISLTNHSYFNMDGFEAGHTIEEQKLTINSLLRTEVGEDLIPTGKKELVIGTPYDFSASKPIGNLLNSNDEQIKSFGGIDHNYHLNREVEGPAVVYQGKETGIILSIYTDMPSCQIYSTNSVKEKQANNGQGEQLVVHGALAIEPQAMPDSMHWPIGDKVMYQPGENYLRKIEYRFE